MPVLIYRIADGTEKRLEFGPKPLIIGRLAESEIQVRDAFLSRVHAAINYANNAFVLKDLGSTNGTYRNGARVYECNLASGDKIQVGNAALRFEIDPTTGDGLLQPAPKQAASIVAAPPLSNIPRPNEKQLTAPVRIPSAVPPVNPLTP